MRTVAAVSCPSKSTCSTMRTGSVAVQMVPALGLSAGSGKHLSNHTRRPQSTATASPNLTICSLNNKRFLVCSAINQPTIMAKSSLLMLGYDKPADVRGNVHFVHSPHASQPNHRAHTLLIPRELFVNFFHQQVDPLRRISVCYSGLQRPLWRPDRSRLGTYQSL